MIQQIRIHGEGCAVNIRFKAVVTFDLVVNLIVMKLRMYGHCVWTRCRTDLERFHALGALLAFQ